MSGFRVPSTRTALTKGSKPSKELLWWKGRRQRSTLLQHRLEVEHGVGPDELQRSCATKTVLRLCDFYVVYTGEEQSETCLIFLVDRYDSLTNYSGNL